MTGTDQQDHDLRATTPQPPAGRETLKWYGPGLLWVLSSVGSGAILFTPRVGARYEYELLWVAVVVMFFQWVMIREVGRYAVVSGQTLLDGFRNLKGPRGWAVWLIFLPGIAAGVATVAGIAALAGSAMMIALPGAQVFYAPALIIVSVILVVSGHYKGIDKLSSVLAIILCIAVIASAAVALPAFDEFGGGLVPGLPDDFDPYFVLPWVGFLLSGAAGIIWFAYWVLARGYGGGIAGDDDHAEREKISDEEKVERLKKWLRAMDHTAILAVLAGGFVTIAFLVLGAEILAEEGIVPEGVEVAEDLTRLLGEIWGAPGEWIILAGIMIALWGTIIANQDGWGRTFADATLLLQKNRGQGGDKWYQKRTPLKNAYALVFTAAIPLVVFFAVREPVDILAVGGTVSATHMPVVIFLTIYLNRKRLPPGLRPGNFITAAAIASGLFFAGFAMFHYTDMLGLDLFGGDEPGE